MTVVMKNKKGHIPDMTPSQKGFQDQTWFQQGFNRNIYSKHFAKWYKIEG